MTIKEFALPDVGEGLTEAEIVNWLVQPGDVVEVNQAIVEIETAKSIVELPSPFAGAVTALHADQGETVDVGRSIISIATEQTLRSDTAVEAPAKVRAESAGEDEPKLLVGYGARELRTQRRRRRSAPANSPAPAATSSARPEPAKATPPVRKLAKDLGVNLPGVTPTGLNGVVTRQDVLRASAVATEASGQPKPQANLGPETEGDIRIPIKGVRKHTAAAMVASAFTAPHVTEFVTVDVSRMMALRAEVGRLREFKDIKLSPLAFVCRAFLKAVERTPQANSRWEEETQEIVQLREVNLGIAAATPRGLVVPNIKSAQRMPLVELATAIGSLAATAREGKTEVSAMANGTITVTNIGIFGIDSGTPILNPGEAAILAVGAVRRMPWVVDDEKGERIEARSVMQLALSFDHRVMDGQQGSQLLADTAALLREPGLAIL
ncbi:dihydrolipoamide acetyltransferase family protein [Arthrobacter sp. 2MCAF15]|uniref:dihydrolipoamide acetyltransferase family protein n=1 Tax=Arthrobacter sp. 2MCAF15 TaxID=3232984 RepID=UPI003F90BAD2